MRTEGTFDRVTHALVRPPGRNFAEGICPAIGIPDYERALLQHASYCAALEKCGVEVTTLKTESLFPDGCFVSDMAIIAGNLAVVCNFSDDSPRQGEQKAAAGHLSATRFLKFIAAPGRLDGGDVLQIQDRFSIGLSDHTNAKGAEQLSRFLAEFGYKSDILDLEGDSPLRLRMAATYLGRDRLLIREDISKHYAFLQYEKIVVPREEGRAANAIMVNGTLILPAGCPDTRAQLRAAGIPVIETDVSEFEKMNGGLNCLSLRLPAQDRGNVVSLPERSRRIA
jgi:dimethylargininase